MAIRTNNPIEVEGKVFDRLAANLALSPMWKNDGIGVSIAVRLTPYRMADGAPERLDDAAQAVVYGDATQEAQTDPDVRALLVAFEAAAQEFVDAKGL